MRALLVFLSMSLMGQELPVIGRYLAADGTVRRVEGVPGALVSRPEVAQMINTQWVPDETGVAEVGGGWWVVNARWIWNESVGWYLLPAAEPVSLQLFTRDPEGGETAVAGTIAFPATAVESTSVIRFRVRNTTSAAVTISRLSIDPGAFTLFDQFFPPRVIESKGFADFSLRFAPAAAGRAASTLHLNDMVFAVQGDTVESARIEQLNGGNWGDLKSDLGSVERGTALDTELRVTPVETGISLTGQWFTLIPGAEPGRYTVRFLAPSAGTYPAVLDTPGRSYPLRATANEYAPPRPRFSLLPGAVEAAKQVEVKIALDEAARAAAVGSLELAFAPDSPGLGDDASVQLLPKAVRTIPFEVVSGAKSATFDTQPSVFAQTGTTAGTITLTAKLGSWVETVTLKVSAGPVVYTSTKAAVGTSSAEVLITGYDTTHAGGKIAFTFYLSGGGAVTPGRMEADIGSQFAEYCAKNRTGSFQLRAVFPVAGTASELESVEVEMTNGQGVQRTGKLPLH